MVMKWTCLCLVALALLDGLCDAQDYSKYQKPQRPAPPPPPPPPAVKQRPQEPVQQKQTFEAPLTWTYPEEPEPEPEPEVPFEQEEPAPPQTVAVECGESTVHIEVKKDMFESGQLINPSDLTLGSCGAVAEDSAAQVLIFESQLHDCGSTLQMTDDSFVYSFVLQYDPQTSSGGGLVVRSSSATVLVQCHYPRRHNVSSLPLDPVWVPFSEVKRVEEFLYFTLKLVTEEGYERPSNVFFMGRMITIEATVKQFYHVPLRVFVDSCVASASPDVNSNPRYAFIEDNGCLVDALVTGSSSQFMPRTAENKLRFNLEAFRFQGVESGLIYITCNLRATSTSYPIDSENRACSYIGGWQEVSGVSGACDSCQSSGPGGSGVGTGVSASPSGGSSWQSGGSRWQSGGGSHQPSGGSSWHSGGSHQPSGGSSWHSGGSHHSSGGSSWQSGGSNKPSGGSRWQSGGGGRKARSVVESHVYEGVLSLAVLIDDKSES